MRISVALAAYSEEKNLPNCLDSVSGWVDEIVVVDGSSKDKTVEIAKKYKAKVVICDNPPIFHINKQKAIDACTGDWILQLDADEIVTEELKEEILETVNRRQTTDDRRPINGYYLPRRNFFLGHWMKKGGLYPDYVVRLVKKNRAHFPCRSIHEQIVVDGEIGYLKNDLLHYTNNTLKDYWKKSILRNAKLDADKILSETKKNSLKLAVKYLIYLPIYWFYFRYFRHKGMLHGIYGLIFAIGSSICYPISYIKYLQIKKVN